MSFYGLWKGWELTEVLGKDDFGAVYSATVDGQEIDSVVKVVNIPVDAEIIDKMLADGKSLSDAEDILQPIVDRWIDEIISKDTMAGNDNIVKIQDYKLSRYPYAPVFMLYIRLEKLSTISDYFANVPVNANTVAKLGADICSALEMCESANIVKSEVSPRKLYVSSNGTFKLGGFESSRGMAIPGYMDASTAPSPDYLAPEVIKGGETTSLSNIYSLGLVMYTVINGGKLPFVTNMNDRDEVKAAIVSRLDSGVKFDIPAGCDEALAKIILKATTYAPEERFASLKEMGRAIRAYNEKDFQSLNLILEGKAAEVFANDAKPSPDSEEGKAAAAAAAAEAALAKKQAEAAEKAAEEERRRAEKLKKEQDAAAAKEAEAEKRAAEKRDARDQKIARAKAAEEARLAEQQAEAERREAERIEAEKKAKAEAEAKAKAEAEAKAKAEAEAKAKAEAEAKAKTTQSSTNARPMERTQR
ncbi:MAG: protein kinase, partial [Clostridia bacterium]|nr:protein kinase [Clostridia bacterium]